MSHKIEWLVDKRVLYIEYTGIMTKETLLALDADMNQCIDQGEAPIHIIVDNSQMTEIKLNLKTIQQSFSTMRNPAWGQVTIIAGDNKMVRFFAQLIGTSFRIKLRLVKSMDEAKAIINQQDNMLELA